MTFCSDCGKGIHNGSCGCPDKNRERRGVPMPFEPDYDVVASLNDSIEH